MIKNKNRDYQRLINSQRWVKLRKAYISAHPLCEDCLLLERTTLAQEVHHIRPIEDYRGNPLQMEQLAYDPTNLRALCQPCHKQAHVRLRSQSKEANRRRQDETTRAFIARFLSPPTEE